MTNPFAPPRTDPSVEPAVGQRLVRQQSFAGALVGGLMGAIVVVGLWVGLTLVTRWESSIFLFFVGIVVGGFVRFTGRGLEARFGMVGLFFTLLATLVCIAWGGAYGFGLLFVLPSLAFGFMLSFRRLSFDEERAVVRDNLPRPGVRPDTPTAAPAGNRRRRRRRR